MTRHLVNNDSIEMNIRDRKGLLAQTTRPVGIRTDGVTPCEAVRTFNSISQVTAEKKNSVAQWARKKTGDQIGRKIRDSASGLMFLEPGR